jgi:hypothetical protein
MKKLLVACLVVAAAIPAVFLLKGPLRFRLHSKSPSGDAWVMGLRFQGREAATLDGKLRLFVYHHQMETRRQTTIPWSRDLKIVWKKGSVPEAFVVEEDGIPQLEFQLHPSGIECSRGKEFLAADPYN